MPPALPPGFGVFCTTVDYRGTAPFAADVVRVVRERFGLDTALTTCNQVHSANVARATNVRGWRECDACDALWSGENAVSLGIKVADCLPVTMVDPSHSVIANIHSGWRGAVQRITSETLATIQRETSFDPSQAYAYLGPSIRTCCFEVGEEVVDAFASSYDGAQRFVDRTRAKAHIDLVALTSDVLRRAGIERISDSGLCTRCDGSIFHSFRRDGKGGGRNLQVAAQ